MYPQFRDRFRACLVHGIASEPRMLGAGDNTGVALLCRPVRHHMHSPAQGMLEGTLCQHLVRGSIDIQRLGLA